MAERFGLEEIRGHVLNTKGVTRVNHGDLGGIADAEESIAIAERLNSAEALIRGYKNFGSTLMELGDLPRATELEQRGLEVALRFGLEFQVMWFETELGILAYWSGDWDASDLAFGRLQEWVGSVGPHYMEAASQTTRAKLRAARGDQAGAGAGHRGRARVRPPLARPPVASPDARRRRAHQRVDGCARRTAARLGAVRRGRRWRSRSTSAVRTAWSSSPSPSP